MKQNHESIMVATLGGQAQVVTFALDILLAQGEAIREVHVLYLATDGSRVNHALNQLMAEFVDDCYAGQPCRLRPIAIHNGLHHLPDIQTEAHAQVAQKMLQDLIVSLKAENYHLHVCLGGGRRMLALLLMTIAQFHFDYRDKLWHIYTPDTFQNAARNGAILHARPEDGVRLIQVPLVPLGSHFPPLRALTQSIIESRVQPALNRLDEQERERCQQVIAALTDRELETLRAFAAGLSLQDVADQLGNSADTIKTNKKKILHLCRNAWPERKIENYYRLRELFGPYFEQ